jgi:predicted PurR-regulated permease PerM
VDQENVLAERVEVDGEQREPLIPRIRITRGERNRLILVGLAAFVLLWLLFNAWDALGPFVIALVLAYLMAPLVDRLARVMPRVVAILLVYLVFIGVVAGLLTWLIPAVVHQVRDLADNIPAYQKQLEGFGSDLVQWYQSLPISPDVRQSIENAVRNSFGAIGSVVQQALVNTFKAVTGAFGYMIGLLIIPFWLFYVLKDKDRGITALNEMLPRAWRNDVWRIFRIINGILSSYIRGQLLLGLVVGVAVTIGMLIVGAPYAILLGLISGLTEIVPVIGPILGAIPGLAVAAFHPEGWLMVVKVLAVYIIVQQLENNLLVPKIQGDSVKLHPSIIMVAIVVGSQVMGLIGLVIAVPVAAMLRDLYLYLYRRFAEGYDPREAEASVPSREDEESAGGKARLEQELEVENREPGVQSADEMIEDVETAQRSKVDEGKQAAER